jgi:valyl-tRNA synthetase
MSKSEGTGIDPKDVLNKFGAEPFRLWAAVEGNLEKNDFRCSFDRIEGAGKTLTKLWNITRFISMFEKPNKRPELCDLDKFIIQELGLLIEDARNRFEKYDFHNPTIKIKNFIWELFASHYIELIKNRAYNENKKFSKQEQDSAIFTLYYSLDRILEMLAPVNPLFTHKLYYTLNKKDVHEIEFPKPEKKYKQNFTKEELMELNSNIWKSKKEKGLSLKEEIKTLTIPNKFNIIVKDLKETHKAKEVKFGKFKIIL